MAEVFGPTASGAEIPPRPALAFQLIMALSPTRRTIIGLSRQEPEHVAPERSKGEDACYRAALQCLRLYFAGEMNYGDVDPNSTDKFLLCTDLPEAEEDTNDGEHTVQR